jgi:predicted nuclease of predicted toxin-antitoxin system
MGLIKFLLDENIPVKVKQLFKKFGHECQTIQERGWSGYKDSEISTRIQNQKLVFITRDKDFSFLWKKYKLKVIFLAIEPAVLSNLVPKIEELLSNWKYDTSQPFLLKIQNDSLRFWK